MSYEWDASSSDVESSEFDVWSISNREEANREIARRIDNIKKQHQELVEIAERFNINVEYELSSDLNRGHNRDVWVNWNPSSQHC